MSNEDLKREVKKQKNVEIVTAQDLAGGETIINLATPEPWLMRKKAVTAAKRGEYKKTDCPHPVSRAVWNFDHVNEADRHGRPTNWFECTQCGSMLFLVDPYGTAASDG